MHSKETATSAGNTDTLPKSVGVPSKEGQRSVNARSVDKDIMNDVGHEVTHQHTGKGGTQGKGKVKGKKGRRLNELRELPEEQWASGSWEQWSEELWQTDVDSVS